MKNYLLEFIETNNRKPSQEEVGELMAVVAKSEPGNLLHRGYEQAAISNILKLQPASVKSIINKQSLPRHKDMILNYQEAK